MMVKDTLEKVINKPDRSLYFIMDKGTTLELYSTSSMVQVYGDSSYS